ncbi:hypothetical protein [Alcaligenes faecalis]|uniref:hypothetical protein n=1 Tax=Alcaligenes faecalis TaxID=511 RepID=UPI002933BF0F|nr:hypothetical protein [Alcaligenes faecalis]MDV2115140.1 hypothetical protein [Alcaligenes faecalis]
MTEHVLHTVQDVTHNIHDEMAEEAHILVIFQQAQERLKEILEISDQDTTRVIRSLKESGWHVSGKLKQAYPQLETNQR